MDLEQILLCNWLENCATNIHPVPGVSDVCYYGTGESAHWAVQSNWNTVSAFAVNGFLQNRASDIQTALSLFNYALRTHKTGDITATDGKQWQNSWISTLGIERASCGLRLLESYMSPQQLQRWRTLRLDSAQWLLENMPVVADIHGSSGKNKPESNLWNGIFLLRTALDYPDSAFCPSFQEKGTSLILNGISLERDADSEELFAGKPLREWHKGANFTDHFSLDHHGYMNVGYSFICLSNVAIAHYYFKQAGVAAPPALYLHVPELWKTLKHFLFADGRLLRIGGDSRSRYTYCQVYALMVFLFARDYLNDSDAAEMESGFLELMRKEQMVNSDGSFYGKRLCNIREDSFYYYSRLESDPPAILAAMLQVRNHFKISAAQTSGDSPDLSCVWTEPYHGAALIRTPETIRSFVAAGAQGPVALCVPAKHSDMAEWQNNLFCDFKLHWKRAQHVQHKIQMGKNWFIGTNVTDWLEVGPYGEGEENYAVVRSHAAIAALPDGQSLLICEYAVVLKAVTLGNWKIADWKLPNDCYNDGRRFYQGDGDFRLETASLPETAETIPCGTRLICADHCVALEGIYGMDQLYIRREKTPQITLLAPNSNHMHSLYVDEICGGCGNTVRLEAGTILADTAIRQICNIDFDAAKQCVRASSRLPGDGLSRAVRCTGTDGIPYLFAVNFDTCPHSLQGKTILPGESMLTQAE